MWKFTALTCLAIAVVCAAQPPPPHPTRPKLTETFFASGNAEIRRGVTLFGTARLIRNVMLEAGLEDYMWDNNGTHETTENLERYDMGEEFKIRTNMSVPHCQTEKTNGRKLPPFWDWVQHAHYAGNITVRDVAYDHWVFHTGGVRFEVGVGKTESNRPYYFARQTAESFLSVGIEIFVLEPPPLKLFEVPKSCVREVKTKTTRARKEKRLKAMRNSNTL